MRILFQVYNRRGLGHLMRSLNLARAIYAIEAQARIVFYARSVPPDGMVDPRIRCFVESDADGLGHWQGLVDEFAPQLIVYDTMLPKDERDMVVDAGTKRVYIMRRSKEERQRQIFANPNLERMALILVPHDEAEFGYALPGGIKAKTRFVGPIVREPDRAEQARLRSRYAVGEGQFLLTSTVGGGGFQDHAQRFFDVVFRAHSLLVGSLPDFRHIVVQGPKFGGELSPPPGMRLVEAEPDLVSLLALSTLVVAEAGYNTIQELRVTRVPAVLLPSPRTNDDQGERAAKLAEAGLAIVADRRDPDAAATQIAALCCDQDALAGMRAQHARLGFATGNRLAAQAMVDLACR